MFSKKRKIIQASDDVQIYVQETQLEDNDEIDIKQEVSDDWESNKAAETMISKLSQCEKFLKIIVNNTKRINSLNERKRMFSVNYEPGSGDPNNEFHIDDIEGEPSSSMTEQSSKNLTMTFVDLKEINRIFPLKTADEIFEVNDKLMKDVAYRKRIILFFKSNKYLAGSNFVQALQSFVTDEALMDCNWDVQWSKTKRPLFKLELITNILFEEWFSSSYPKFESAMREYLKRSHNRLQKRRAAAAKGETKSQG